MSNNDGQKENIADLYSRVASMYGFVGPNNHAYPGEHLIERLGMKEGAHVLDVAAGRGGNYSELPQYLTQASFINIQTLYKEADFAYTGAQQWWDNLWTHGTPYSLEHMTPEVLAQFKAEVFARLDQEAHIYVTLRFQFVLASKR